MKKALSILLVAILLLNVMGYYAVFLGVRYTHKVQFTKRLNEEKYNDADLHTIKVPLAIPYYGDTEFERVDGEIQYEGEFFRLVKQQLLKDTLVIVMIKDHKAGQMHKVLADYVTSFTDHAADRSNGKGLASIIKEYCASTFSIEAITDGWIAIVSYPAVEESLVETDLPLTSPPPKV